MTLVVSSGISFTGYLKQDVEKAQDEKAQDQEAKKAREEQEVEGERS